jgi:hypothetical protein
VLDRERGAEGDERALGVLAVVQQDRGNLFEGRGIVRRRGAGGAIPRESFVDAPALVVDVSEIAQRRHVGGAELDGGLERALGAVEVSRGGVRKPDLDVELRALGAGGGRFLR